MSDALLPRRLSALDALFLYAETDEAPLHIGGVDILDGDLSTAGLVKRLEQRLTAEAPRYAQRVVPAPLGLGHPVWEDDPAFAVRLHVHEVVLEPPGDEAALQACAARLFSSRLDRNRPLWELHVVRGLAGGRSALVAKIHHCMVDGVSGVELLKIIFDFAPEGSPPPPGPVVRTHAPATPTRLVIEALWNTATEVVDAARSVARGAVSLTATLPDAIRRAVEGTAALAGAAVTPVARLPFNRPLSGVRRLGWLTFPLPELKALARARRGTVNDVALAVLTDGIGRLLTTWDFPIGSRSLRILVPVSVRNQGDARLLGNRVSMIPVEVPLDADPVARLDSTVARSGAMKRAGIANLVELASEAGGLVPAALYARAWSVAASSTFVTWSAPVRAVPVLTANLVCTNVPGPPVPLYGLGHRVLAHYPLVPLGFDTGLNCALLPYNQVLHVGLVADAAAIDDLAPLTAHLKAAFVDLREAIDRARVTTPRPAVSSEGAPPLPGEVNDGSTGNPSATAPRAGTDGD